MLSLARALSLGETPFECPRFQVERPVRVLYIEHELKPWGLQKRVKPIFGDVDPERYRDTFFYVSGEPAVQFSSFEGYETMQRLVDEVQPEVLMLDPIGKMHYANENDNGEINKLLHKMDMLLKSGADRGMSMVFAHHFGKPAAVIQQGDETRDPLDPYNFRGASKWKDDPDVRVTMVQGKLLPLEHKAWLVETRFLTRQGAGHPDLLFSVNRDANERVMFERELRVKKPLAGTPKPSEKGDAKSPQEPLVQAPSDKPEPIEKAASDSPQAMPDAVNPGESPVKTFRRFIPAAPKR